jgi:hypothetical protein
MAAYSLNLGARRKWRALFCQFRHGLCRLLAGNAASGEVRH